MEFGDYLFRLKLTLIVQRQHCKRKAFFPLLAAVQAYRDNTYNYFYPLQFQLVVMAVMGWRGWGAPMPLQVRGGTVVHF